MEFFPLGKADRQLLQDFWFKEVIRVYVITPKEFVGEDLEKIGLVIAESSLARKFSFDLLALNQEALYEFFCFP